MTIEQQLEGNTDLILGIEALELSTRVYNCLAHPYETRGLAPLPTIGHVLTQTKEKLKQRGLGPKSVNELHTALADRGLKIEMLVAYAHRLNFSDPGEFRRQIVSIFEIDDPDTTVDSKYAWIREYLPDLQRHLKPSSFNEVVESSEFQEDLAALCRRHFLTKLGLD